MSDQTGKRSACSQHGTKQLAASALLPHNAVMAVCGHSGTGKTTLIEKLIPRLAADMSVGYIKHDGHSFTMDTPGKDTRRAALAGASIVWINDSQKSATLRHYPSSMIDACDTMMGMEAVIIEGWKNGPMPCCVMSDKNGSLPDEVIPDNIVAVITPTPGMQVETFLCLHRDDLDGIERAWRDYWNITRPVLNGLVLTGGKSSRMKRDKAALAYHGIPQTQHAYNLLKSCCEDLFVSCRFEQSDDPDKRDLPQLHDRFLDMGPMGGILTAFSAHPDRAWLVVACDLPYLNSNAIDFLISQRAAYRTATAFLAPDSGLPEPLCAIYEPRAYPLMLHRLSKGGKSCPRSFLKNEKIAGINQQDPIWLENVNTAEEYEQTMEYFKGS
jgi:molybdopterin-guanine dinucleotide biosynthesis protein MobB